MTQQGAQLTLQFGSVMFGGQSRHVGSPITMRRLQRIAPETPFEGTCRLIVLAHSLLGALAQVCGAGMAVMAGMAQHTTGVAGKPMFDRIAPACVQTLLGG